MPYYDEPNYPSRRGKHGTWPCVYAGVNAHLIAADTSFAWVVAPAHYCEDCGEQMATRGQDGLCRYCLRGVE